MYRLVYAAIVALTGCTAAPKASVEPPPAPKLSGNETIGEKVALASRYCSDYAQRQCPANTVYCDGYRSEFYRMCLVRVNVPPEYITALTVR